MVSRRNLIIGGVVVVVAAGARCTRCPARNGCGS